VFSNGRFYVVSFSFFICFESLHNNNSAHVGPLKLSKLLLVGFFICFENLHDNNNTHVGPLKVSNPFFPIILLINSFVGMGLNEALTFCKLFIKKLKLEEKRTTNKSFIKNNYFSSLTKSVGFCNHNLYLLEVVEYFIYVQLVFFFQI
jgi:hypothetical protein